MFGKVTPASARLSTPDTPPSSQSFRRRPSPITPARVLTYDSDDSDASPRPSRRAARSPSPIRSPERPVRVRPPQSKLLGVVTHSDLTPVAVVQQERMRQKRLVRPGWRQRLLCGDSTPRWKTVEEVTERVWQIPRFNFASWYADFSMVLGQADRRVALIRSMVSAIEKPRHATPPRRSRLSFFRSAPTTPPVRQTIADKAAEDLERWTFIEGAASHWPTIAGDIDKLCVSLESALREFQLFYQELERVGSASADIYIGAYDLFTSMQALLEQLIMLPEIFIGAPTFIRGEFHRVPRQVRIQLAQYEATKEQCLVLCGVLDKHSRYWESSLARFRRQLSQPIEAPSTLGLGSMLKRP